jgi:hypothetical protein
MSPLLEMCDRDGRVEAKRKRMDKVSEQQR